MNKINVVRDAGDGKPTQPEPDVKTSEREAEQARRAATEVPPADGVEADAEDEIDEATRVARDAYLDFLRTFPTALQWDVAEVPYPSAPYGLRGCEAVSILGTLARYGAEGCDAAGFFEVSLGALENDADADVDRWLEEVLPKWRRRKLIQTRRRGDYLVVKLDLPRLRAAIGPRAEAVEEAFGALAAALTDGDAFDDTEDDGGA
jgi:hypothetical protein